MPQVIAYLETGAGKTIIDVLLVKYYTEQYVKQLNAGIPAQKKVRTPPAPLKCPAMVPAYINILEPHMLI